MDIGKVLLKGAKVVTGVQAFQDRKEAKSVKEDADSIKKEIDEESNNRKNILNDKLSQYAISKVDVLKSTIGVFQKYMERIKIQNKDKYYELLNNIRIDEEQINTLATIEMNASQVLKTALAGGSAAVAAAVGIPAAVAAHGVASTGIAISALHGVAAHNAVLAAIGGGSVATGGLGMTGGAIILGSTASVAAIAAAGVVASAVFSKKLTEAKDYHAQVLQYKEECQREWGAFDAIGRRTDELQSLMNELGGRTEKQLEFLEPLIYDFTAKDSYYIDVFNKVKDFLIALSKLAQTPIIEDGVLSESSSRIQLEISNVLNKEL